MLDIITPHQQYPFFFFFVPHLHATQMLHLGYLFIYSEAFRSFKNRQTWPDFQSLASMPRLFETFTVKCSKTF